ncbi:MAG TPA: ABC transporter permease [Bryobacteraceae bacterium]|nr:ABC transporter permease [Bryobacteraceae bacterium]
MLPDLLFTFRTLRRSPMFTAVAVASLALGIGANTAIFSLLDQVVLRSLPVHDPERLVTIHREYSPNGTSSSDSPESVFSYPMYRQLRDGDPAFDGIIARMASGVRVAWHGSVESARAEMVSGNFFQVLGVPAAAGRTLLPEDNQTPGASPVAVLGYGYWMTRFAGDRAVAGAKVAINGLPFTVVGVADPHFHGVLQGEAGQLFVPIAMQRTISPTVDVLEDPQYRWLTLFARLKPGESLARAQAASEVVYHRIIAADTAQLAHYRTERARQEYLNHTVQLHPAAQGISALRDKWDKPLRVLMVMVGLVLLIACANVAGLLVARATGRRREISIRLAIGAGRGDIVRQLLIEGLVLAMAGGALALLVDRWCTAALLGMLPRDAFNDWVSAGVDLRLFLFTFALAAVSGLLFALVPALQATRTDLAVSLKTQSANVAGGGAPARLRQVLVTGQVALSMMLAVGAGLFAVSMANLLKADLGFRPERLLIFDVNAVLDRPHLADAVAFYHELTTRLTGLPGVTAVGASNSGLFGGGRSGGNITVEGYRAAENEETDSNRMAVSPGYFQALGIPLRTGRDFTERDETATAVRAVIVNEAFVKRYLSGRNPIGARFMSGASNHPVFNLEIVGVAANNRSEPRGTVMPAYYYPYAQWEKPDRLTFCVRSALDQTRLAGAIRQAVRASDPLLPAGRIESAETDIRNSLYTERLISILAAAFGLLATGLAAIGMYGVMAYAVARRTGEIGVRMALGAVPSRVVAMILQEAGRLVLAGIVLGWIAAFGLGRFVEAQLYGVHSANLAIYLAATVVLVAAALAAALLPGWRAARIDPVVALKYE